MKILNLDLDFKVSEEHKKAQNLETNADITRVVLQSCIGLKFGQKMSPTDSRMWVRLQDKLEKANGVPLEDSEFDWLERNTKDLEVSPAFARSYWILRTHIEELKESKTPHKKEE